MFRYKALIGRGLRARSLPAQKTEARVACSVLKGSACRCLSASPTRGSATDPPPSSELCTFSDVKVVSSYNEIPWTELSRISDEEMKRLMIEIVDRVLTFLNCPEELAVRSAQTRTWQRPRVDPKLMRTVQRWRVARSAAESDTA